MYLKKTLPPVIGNDVKNFFLKSFRDQGFTDKALEKWPEVNRRIKDTKEYLYPKKKKLGRRTKAINVNTGRFRKSIIVIEARFNKIVVGSVGVPYAKYVNEKRQVVGDSAVLRAQLKKKIKKEMDKILRGK